MDAAVAGSEQGMGGVRGVGYRGGKRCAGGILLLVVAAQASAQQAHQPAPVPVVPSQSTPAQSGSNQSLQRGAAAVVSGTVSEADGDLIVGATVKVVSPAGTIATVTDSDGRFRVNRVDAGDIMITAAFPGFDARTVTVSVRSGDDLELKPIELKISEVDTDVEVTLPPHELATEQIHQEEQQRLIGLLPNFFISYNPKALPLSAGQKFALSWANVRDPGNLALVGLTAGIQQANDAFPGYGQGIEGYGRRFGADFGNLVAGTFMGGAVLPALFRQDPRYFYKGTGTIRQRFVYAVTRAVICRGDNGHNQPAFASVLGDLSAGAISNAYYPASDRNGVTLTFENGLLGIAGDALNGLFNEFFSKHLTTGVPKAATVRPATGGPPASKTP